MSIDSDTFPKMTVIGQNIAGFNGQIACCTGVGWLEIGFGLGQLSLFVGTNCCCFRTMDSWFQNHG